MALTKSRTSHLASQTATVSDATAQSNAETMSDAYAAQLLVKCVQVGTATTAASIIVWVRGASGLWTKLTTITFGTAAATYYNVVDLPNGCAQVGVAYTAQSGGTSSTLDVDLVEITAL